MIIDTSKIEQIYLVCGKTDLRKGIDGLAGIVQEQYDLDPYSQALYLFCGTRKDR
ncbi:IS66 family insertion sequence element accessory protein TnpB, partial [Streptococcus thermophilus]|nr:IS66 family insertion sequence element accessory protein TnpB [Streptococcus thermophilus]